MRTSLRGSSAESAFFCWFCWAAFAWYSTTADFNQRVGNEVVNVLEDATGGRVELEKISFNMWHLAIEADGLVIHGLEGPGEAPYLSADKIQVRVKIFSFFSHAAGTGIASHISLNYLRVDHPQVHLMIDKNGKTNQPVPKHPSTSNKPVIDTLLDLKAKQVELANGVFLLNDRAIPFDLAARDLDAEVHYIASSDHYGATVDLKDLRTKLGNEPEADSTLHVEAEVGRNMAELKNLVLHTGKASNLKATASLNNFAHPEWQASVDGSLELKQIAVLSGVDGLKAGTVDLNLKGHSCNTTPAVAQKHPQVLAAASSEVEDEAEYQGTAARSRLRCGISAGRDPRRFIRPPIVISTSVCTMWMAARNCTSRRRSYC